MTEANVIQSGENLSDHSPIYFKLNVGQLDAKLEEEKVNKVLSWKKSTDDDKNNFYESLKDKINNVDVPDSITCKDINCSNHMDELETYCMDVLQSIENSAKETLLLSGGNLNKERTVPGWNQNCKIPKEQSIFWHSIWKSAGSPNKGALYDVMLHTKYQYEYAARRLKRAKDKIQNDKFIEGVSNGNVNIFKEIKKFRVTTKMCSSVVDSQTGSQNISNKFAEIYSNLYSQSDSVDTDLINLKNKTNNDIGDNTEVIDKINESLIKEAINRMKVEKSDVMFEFSSDCIINAPEEIYTHIANMFKSFLVHGNVSYFLLLCTLIPIVKDN